jgi:replicative DNA helicase
VAAVQVSAQGRVPPHDLEAETSVLGAILLDQAAVTRILDQITPEDFYRENNAQIYRAAINLFREGEPIDNVTLAAELGKLVVLERVGGRAHLALLQESVPTAANIEHYARIVKDRAYKRRLISAGSQVTGLGYNDSLDAEEAVNQAQAHVYAISDDKVGTGLERIYDLLKPAMDRIDAQMASGGGVIGIPSGFHDLDRMTNGFKAADLAIIAGRPSMGKTSFVLNVTLHAAVEQKKPVAIFSLEMSKEQLVERMLCEQARIDAQRLHRGTLSDIEYERLAGALGPLGDAPIFIDDSPTLDDLTLRLKSRQARSREGIEMIVLDYLQLMQGRSNSGDSNRVQEVSAISRALKSIARELRIPVIAISQLSRAPEARPDKRPILSDLRESGCMPASARLLRADTGQEVTLGELVLSQEQPVVWSINEGWRLVPRRLTRAFPTGIRHVFQLRLASGRQVEATANHPFRTVRGWQPLGELTAGDLIAVARRLPPPLARTGWNEDELVLLAHLLGDGSIGLPGVKYATSDLATRDAVCQAAQRRFGIEPRGDLVGNTWQMWFPSPHRLTHGRHHPMREWLDGLGLWGLRAPDKFIPEAVHSLPDKQLALFLRHLWATDGSITARLDGRGSVIRVYYATSSRRMADGVLRILLRLDIRSRIRRTRKRGYCDGWAVDVTGARDSASFLERDSASFLEVVGCHGKRGDIVPQCLQALSSIKSNPNVDLIPWAVAGQVRSSLVAAGVTQRALAAALDERCCGSYLLGSETRPRRFSRGRLAQMGITTGDDDLVAMATSDVLWDEVVGITPLGEKPTFDATVEGTHNFIADGVIAHNSIEQDADIVMFLYRDEYYNREKSEKPGIAEIIVAKHRNGPTGMIELMFRKELTRFENLERRRPESVGPDS